MTDRTLHSLADLLVDLGLDGVEIARHEGDPDRLQYCPIHLASSMLTRLRTHKYALLNLLLDGPDLHADEDASYTYLERLGVADDLGLPTHPGSSAWAIAVGEALALMRPNDTSMTSTSPVPRSGNVADAEAHTHFRHDAGDRI